MWKVAAFKTKEDARRALKWTLRKAPSRLASGSSGLCHLGGVFISRVELLSMTDRGLAYWLSIARYWC